MSHDKNDILFEKDKGFDVRNETKHEKTKTTRDERENLKETSKKQRNEISRKEKNEIQKHRDELLKNKLKETVEKSVFDHDERLVNDIKEHHQEILFKISNEQELRNYAEKHFDNEAKERLHVFLDAKDDSVTNNMNRYEIVKEFALIERIENLNDNRINILRDRDELIKDEKELEKIDIMYRPTDDQSGFVRELMVLNREISELKHPHEAGNILNFIRSEKYQVIDVNKILNSKFVEKNNLRNVERVENIEKDIDISDKFKFYRNDFDIKDLKDDWKIDKNDPKDLQRAELFEKVIDDLNLPKYTMDILKEHINTKEDLQEFLESRLTMNRSSEYDFDKLDEKGLAYTVYEYTDEFGNKGRSNVSVDVDQILTEKLSVEQFRVASWSLQERSLGYTPENPRYVVPKKDSPILEDSSRNDLLDVASKNKLFEKLDKIADKSNDGKYVFKNNIENKLNRFSLDDKQQLAAILHFSMKNRDDEEANKFVDAYFNRDNISEQRSVRGESTEQALQDILQSRMMSTNNNDLSRNGFTLAFARSESLDYPYVYTNRAQFEDYKEANNFGGKISDILNVKSSRELSLNISKDLELGKDYKENARLNTDKIIDRLAQDKNVIQKFSNERFEKLITKGSTEHHYGKEVDEKAQKLYELHRFGKTPDSKEKVEKQIELFRKGDREERSIASAFDLKTKISEAYIKGQLFALAEESRIEAGLRNTGRVEDSMLADYYVFRTPELNGLSFARKEQEVRVNFINKVLHVNLREREETLNRYLASKDMNEFKVLMQEKVQRDLNQDELDIHISLARFALFQKFEATSIGAINRDSETETNRVIDALSYSKIQRPVEDRAIGVGESKSFREEYYKGFSDVAFMKGQFKEASTDTFSFMLTQNAREVYVQSLFNKDYKEELAKKDEFTINRTANILFKDFLLDKMDNYAIRGMTPNAVNQIGFFKEHNWSFNPKEPETMDLRPTLEMINLKNVYEGKDTYIEMEDGRYTSETMGLIPKSKRDELVKLFNGLENPTEFEKYGGQLDRDTVIELIARYRKIDYVHFPVSAYKDRESYKDFNKDFFRSYAEDRTDVINLKGAFYTNNNVRFLVDTLEREIDLAKAKPHPDIPPLDPKFKDLTVWDLLERDSEGKLIHQDFKEAVAERVTALNKEAYKDELRIQRQNEIGKQKMLYQRNHGKSKVTDAEREKEKIKLELNRERLADYQLRINKIKEERMIHESLIRNQEKIEQLKEAYNSREIYKSRNPFKLVGDFALRREISSSIKNLEEKQRELLNFKKENEEKVVEAKDRVSALTARLSELKNNADKERIDKEEEYINQRVQEMYNLGFFRSSFTYFRYQYDYRSLQDIRNKNVFTLSTQSPIQYAVSGEKHVERALGFDIHSVKFERLSHKIGHLISERESNVLKERVERQQLKEERSLTEKDLYQEIFDKRTDQLFDFITSRGGIKDIQEISQKYGFEIFPNQLKATRNLEEGLKNIRQHTEISNDKDFLPLFITSYLHNFTKDYKLNDEVVEEIKRIRYGESINNKWVAEEVKATLNKFVGGKKNDYAQLINENTDFGKLAPIYRGQENKEDIDIDFVTRIFDSVSNTAIKDEGFDLEKEIANDISFVIPEEDRVIEEDITLYFDPTSGYDFYKNPEDDSLGERHDNIEEFEEPEELILTLDMFRKNK